MISDLIEKYKDAIKTFETAEKVFDLAKLEKEILELRILYFLETNSISELQIDDDEINKIKFSINIFPSVLVKDHQRLKEFLGEDANEVFSEKPSKLRAYVNNMIDEGKEIPEFISLYAEETIKVTKKRKKE